MVAVEPAPHGAAYANRLIAHDYQVTTRSPPDRARSARSSSRCARRRRWRARCCAPPRGALERAPCDTDGGFVIHEGKRLGFGDLPPKPPAKRRPKRPELRPAAAASWPASRCPGSTFPAKSDGSLRFAGGCPAAADDLRLGADGAAGRRLTGFSRDAAKQQQGLIDLSPRRLGWRRWAKPGGRPTMR
jgi:hypothetical protein